MSHFKDKRRKSDLKMQILPIVLATFDFQLATAPKLSNGFKSNFANMCATEREEKSQNFSTVTIRVSWSPTGVDRVNPQCLSKINFKDLYKI